MALAWVLRHPGMTSALVGASRVAQIEDAVDALNNLTFGADELRQIEAILKTNHPGRRPGPLFCFALGA